MKQENFNNSNNLNKIKGRRGENIAIRYLINKGFQIVERNYYKKVGEIDIIARKNGILHFIEVKSVAHETPNDHTNINKVYFPEELVNHIKMLHMKHTIEMYLFERCFTQAQIQINVITVTFYRCGEVPRINFIENVIL